MKNPQKFWDDSAQRYAAKPIADETSYAKTMERTCAHLKPTDEVLEVGCGSGSTAILLAASVAHMTATDLSGKMIDIGRETAQTQGVENITFERTDVEASVAPPKQYDAVLAFNLLHLTRDPATVIRQLRGQIKPGGLFISKSICLEGKWALMKPVIAVMQAFRCAPFIQFMKVRELDNIVRKEGFEIIETGIFPKSPPARFIVARKL